MGPTTPSLPFISHSSLMGPQIIYRAVWATGILVYKCFHSFYQHFFFLHWCCFLIPYLQGGKRVSMMKSWFFVFYTIFDKIRKLTYLCNHELLIQRFVLLYCYFFSTIFLESRHVISKNTIRTLVSCDKFSYSPMIF